MSVGRGEVPRLTATIRGWARGRRVVGTIGDRLPSASVFTSVDQASNFFQGGALGFSSSHGGQLEALELETLNWSDQPLDVSDVESSFFSDAGRFPTGTVEFDKALLMRHIEHRWHQRESPCSCDHHIAAA